MTVEKFSKKGKYLTVGINNPLLVDSFFLFPENEKGKNRWHFKL